MPALTPTTTASEAKAAAHRWVETEGRQIAGFAGAFLHGSINWLAPSDHLPATSDVDVILVVEDAPLMPKLGKFRFEAVLLDVSALPAADFRSPDVILGQYHLAGSFAGPSVIADPTGRLTALQAVVARHYAERRWVRQRCAHALEKVCLSDEPRASDSLPDQVIACLFPAAITTHVLLVAGLRNPTVRNRYLPTRELLREYRRLDFYETLLELLGCADMEAMRVRHHLFALTEAFDAAKAVPALPFPFAADISDAARPVAVDGSRELIQQGNDREAVFWIAVTFSRCMKVLDCAPAVERSEAIDKGYRELLADLGLESLTAQRQRRLRINETLPRVWEVAEAIMDEHPGIDREQAW